MGRHDNNPNAADFINWKFKELHTYCDTEWLGDGKKKYRRVFNRVEVGYLYCEFSFYNKLFDEEDWNCKILLTCNKLEGRTPNKICDISVDKKVLKEENIGFVREGWGNAGAGVFWTRGEYEWVAHIDGKVAGSLKFYVEDEEAVTETHNPFFKITKVNLFEADTNEPPIDQRKYYTTFKGTDTRYLWAEVTMESKLDHDFNTELIFNFFNDENQFKGSTSEVFVFKGKEKIICSGWGSSKGGTWANNKYTVEILFMNTLIAVVPFEVADEFIEGDAELFTTKDMGKGSRISDGSAGNEKDLQGLLAEMNELIGMDNIKTKINDYVNYLNFVKLRKEKGFEENEKISLHAVLTGNPGTGKTTVARILGKIYKAMGLVTKGHVVEVDRADLVAEYIGQTAPKVKKVIDKARGGILFIDEAYSLHRGDDDSKDFGREVIEIVMKEMSDGKGDLAVIVAGYPKEMTGFLNSNPGLKSRFNHYFHFDDYMPDELMAIVRLGLKNKKLNIKDEAYAFLEREITEAYRARNKSFGNARMALGVVDEAKMNMGLRLMKSPDMASISAEDMSTITLADVERMFTAKLHKELDLKIDTPLLRDALNELNALTGLETVKNEINEQVKLVKYYREIGKDTMNKFSLHSVFTGNPGTGKTTVARIYAKILKSLGLIEKGHLVECDRERMVAGYSGQTAIKTAQLVDEAMGGVLFVDEAYALNMGGHDQFGAEAINTLLKRMEDHRGQFVLIAAGYTDNMNEFLKTNPGLQSRFEKTIEFPDYTAAQLIEIANKLFAQEGLKMDAEASAHLEGYLQAAYDARDKFFGNAREVRKIVGEAVKNQNLRMAEMDPSIRTKEMIATVTKADVAEFDVANIRGGRGRKSIGFK
ncbi:MAG TPA: AAA family ATPase [Flavobacteriales bacterium]|nr:AAA family ATPase [Flavobacteriales bacterium]